MKEYSLASVDGYPLDISLFEVENPKAIIQMVHGMQERKERYYDLINFLNQNGYSCLIANTRGHGVKAQTLGFFKDKKGYKYLLEDEKVITSHINKLFPTLPIYLYGHSFGTIILRSLLKTDSIKYDKVILTGYPNYQGISVFGIFMSSIIRSFRGAKYISNFLENNTVGSFNKKIKNPRTKADWTCYNTESVDKYLADPYCAKPFTVSAYNDLYHLMRIMHKGKNLSITANLPILLLSGLDDPATGGEKGRKRSLKDLKKSGFVQVDEKVYPNKRHEIINEKDNNIVYNDILEFYNK